MTGSKASALEQLCATRGQSYVRFNYSGHGQSDGRFIDGTIGRWFMDTLDVFDALTEGPQIVVGSSMGGWMALLLGLKRPERIKGQLVTDDVDIIMVEGGNHSLSRAQDIALIDKKIQELSK